MARFSKTQWMPVLGALVLLGGCYPPGSCPPSSVAGGGSTDGSGFAPSSGDGTNGATSPADDASRASGCGGSDVVVFDDDAFHGRGLVVARGRTDRPQLEAAGSENDSIRSLCVPAGCVVTLFEDEGFEGRSRAYTADTATLDDFAGTATGIDVTCR